MGKRIIDNGARSFNASVTNPDNGHNSLPVLVHILTTYFPKMFQYYPTTSF
jgi:hypothetical protein